MTLLRILEPLVSRLVVNNLAAGGLFALVYLLAAEIGHQLSLGGNVATSWPPSGIYLMTLVSLGRNRWPYLIASAMLANIFSDTWLNGKPLPFALALSTANSVEAVIGALWLRSRASQAFSLECLPDIKRLLVVATLTPFLSAMIAAPSAYGYMNAPFLSTFFVWWIADCVGILTVAPLTWAFFNWTFDSKSRWWRTLELLCSFAVIGFTTTVVFSNYFPAVGFPFLLMPLLYWPALRFGTVAVAGHIGVMAIIIIYATQHDLGPFADAKYQAVVLQAFLATCSVPFLALAAMWHEREQAADEMERRIEIRTRQLADADRRKDHFLAVLAHELRNPLAPLTHALEVWPSLADEPGRLNELRALMSNQLQHMSGLIDDLLDVSRIAGGKILLRRERVDVRETVREAVSSTRSQAEAVGHTIELDLPTHAIWVNGDRARLSQIIGNLLNNAIKYTDVNGLIRLAVHANADSVQITISDNGPGIPATELERIFELFTQVDQTLERAHGGLGIGLTLVKNLVELHGGSVTAESPGLGRGSTFRVNLPLAEPGQGICMNTLSNSGAASQATAATSASNGPLPSRRILVVDDTHASGKMLSLLLKSLGQEVEVCTDGPSALTLVPKYQPTLVFLDIAMPGMNGYEVATRLKSDPSTAGIVLVAMTGFGQASDRQKAFESGFDHHMIKPANLESLKEVIRNA